MTSLASGQRGTHPPVGLRVLVVDDHDVVAESLVLMLRTEGVAAERSSPEAVLARASEFEPAVVLLDLDLGHDGSALPLVKPLTDLPAAVVMFTGVTDQLRLAEAVEAGAVGIVHKGLSSADVLRAVAEAATAGTAWRAGEERTLLKGLRAARRRTEAAQRLFASLTRREGEVLGALCDGLTAAEIAERQYVSVFTVRGHIRAILAKLGVGSQLAAVAMAQRVGWSPGAIGQS